MSEDKGDGRPVIVTTEYRGVFFGYADGDVTGTVVALKKGRMVFRWGTSRGLMELATTGPTERTKVSTEADLIVQKVTAVFDATEAAAGKWRGVQ